MVDTAEGRQIGKQAARWRICEKLRSRLIETFKSEKKGNCWFCLSEKCKHGGLSPPSHIASWLTS